MTKRSDATKSPEELRNGITGLGELERFRSLLNQTNDLIFLATLPEGNIVDLSTSAARRLGGEKAHWIGSPVARVFEGLDIACMSSGEEEVTQVQTSRLVPLTRQALPVQLTLRRVRLEAQDYVVAVAYDITERVHKQAELDRRDAHIRLLMDSTGAGVFGIGPRGECTFCNSAALQMLGFESEADLLGRNIHQLTHHTRSDGSVYPEHVCRAFRPFRDQRPAQVNDEVFWRTDGTCFAVSYCAHPVQRDGQPVGVVVSFVDITDQKRAEVELHRREEAFRALAGNSPDFIARHDLEGRIAYCNPALMEMLGLSSVELLGKTALELGPETKSGPLYQETLLEVVRSGQRAEIEFVLDLLDCTPQPTHQVRFVPEYDQDGNVVSVLTVGRDVSQLKKTERRLRTLVDNLPDMIARFDTSGRYTFVNPEVLKRTGLPEESILGTTILELGSPEDRETNAKLLEKIRRAVAEGMSNRIEIERHFPQGQGYFEVRHIPELDEAQRVVSVLGIARDITEQKQVEQERTAHLRYSTNMDKVNRAMQGARNFDQMMNDVLEILLSIFDCDRAWLIYPCDPTARSWRVPMERTRPEYPGACVQGQEIPTYPDAAKVMRALLEAAEPLSFGPGAERDMPVELARNYDVQFQVAMAIQPKIGKVWAFGLHQCSYAPIWTNEDKKLFSEIGRRLSDGLTSLLVYRDFQESNERFRQIAENIREVFWLTDVTKKKVLYVNPAYEAVWGRSCEVLYTDPTQWLNAIHPDDRRHVGDDIVMRQIRGEYDVEYRIVRPDGTIRYIRDRAFPICDPSGTVYRIAGIAQDITAHKERDARIQYLAYHDALTGLPNRELVMNRLKQAIAQAQRRGENLAVLFFDLDRFKTINDTLGHPAGDTLLQQVGKSFDIVLRDGDTVGRVGGDEFLILLQGLSASEDAAHVASKILESLTTPIEVEGHALYVSASIGISLYPRDANDAAILVKYADSALYVAKEQGRSTFRFFSPELDTKVRARLHMENDLRSAIAGTELTLYYQPMIDLATGEVTGAEALIRWQHPVHGLVSPSDFIPIAEETGLIIPVGEWALRTASVQAQSWQAAGLCDFRVCVNLSRRQLEKPDFVAVVQRILSESGCEPSLLELEITESSIMNEPDQAVEKLESLHKLGIKLALDDFGTGYSNLAYLKRFPLDRLKIDKSFVAGIPKDTDDNAIVQTTIVLARQLRLKVTAEGVETQAQRAFLQDHGCDEMQGYLTGEPIMSHEMRNRWGFTEKNFST